MLTVENLEVVYNDVVLVLRGISLVVGGVGIFSVLYALNGNFRHYHVSFRYPRWLASLYPAIVLFVVLTWLELGWGVTTDPRATAYLGLAMAGMAVTWTIPGPGSACGAAPPGTQKLASITIPPTK